MWRPGYHERPANAGGLRPYWRATWVRDDVVLRRVMITFRCSARHHAPIALDVILAQAADAGERLNKDVPMQTLDLLALRRATVEQRLASQAAVRSVRRASPQSYPITLSWRYLTPQQQQERRENAEDVLRCIGEWMHSDRLSDRQRKILRTLADKLWFSRGTAAMTTFEWEQFWAIRDYLMPDQ